MVVAASVPVGVATTATVTNGPPGVTWSVNGVSRANAHLVSRDDQDRPVYGGTPADFAVVQAIEEMKAPEEQGTYLHPEAYRTYGSNR